MSHNLSVYVLDSDGDPVRGVEVTIYIDGFFKGGSLEEYTDDEGHAEFETADDYEGSRQLKIQVREQTFGPYYISGGSYTVELD
jgi:hypothetical protein